MNWSDRTQYNVRRLQQGTALDCHSLCRATLEARRRIINDEY